MQINVSPDILNRVIKPARYTGQEWGSITKDWSQVAVSYALSLPDVYEVGMSNLGLKILYNIINNEPTAAAERVYAPWTDMEAEMRLHKIPLYTLESFRPVSEFDVVGFSLQYELSFSNILNMLDLAGIPLLASERSLSDPFVVGGGPCVYNAEPVADFFDFFIIGEAEELMVELTNCLAEWKQEGRPGGRIEGLRRVAALAGIYVPQFYQVQYNIDNTVKMVQAVEPGVKTSIGKRVVADLDAASFPTTLTMPYLDIVHDRIMLELFRGCTRGCRFCQAGSIYRPVRERRPETLLHLAKQLAAASGYDEISLVSLSTADYSCLRELISNLQTELAEYKTSVSLPSLRIDSFSVDLAKQVQAVRKSGLTFAPEAGTQRLRDVINKGVTEADLQAAVTSAFAAGWSAIKLYFMIGLPTETDEDILGIAALANRVVGWYRETTGRGGVKVSVSVSTFVPKGQTAFQWEPQDALAEIKRKQDLLKSSIRNRSIALHWHDPEVSMLEAVFARGDRRLSEVILCAWRNGARFDGWGEHFRFQIWQAAFDACGIEPEFYANRRRNVDEIMPWEHIDAGITKSYLRTEYERGLNLELTADCRVSTCGNCGVCPRFGVRVVDGRKA